MSTDDLQSLIGKTVASVSEEDEVVITFTDGTVLKAGMDYSGQEGDGGFSFHYCFLTPPPPRTN